MEKVTITLDEEVARWVRVQAIQRQSSVSRLVGEMLRDEMVTEVSHRASREQFFSIRPRRLREPGRPLPTRQELHDPAGLR